MLNEAETREAVLRWIARPQYVPTKMLIVAQQIGVLKEDFKDFQKLVRNMHKQGLLRFGSGHVVFPADQEQYDERRVVGYFKRHSEGYGFVREVELNPNAENISDEDRDIFIPPGKSQDAATGDLVAVLVDEEDPSRRGFSNSGKPSKSGKPGRDGKLGASSKAGSSGNSGDSSARSKGRSGKIINILERGRRSFVGTYIENHDGNWVEVDGRVFTDPIRIPDVAGSTVRPGDKVVIDILSFPADWRAGEGVITEVLGPRGDLKTDTLSVIRQFNLRDDFSDTILSEARSQVEQFETWENAHQHLLESMDPDAPFSSEAEASWTDDGRRDLRNLYTITIDPETARDFDDAISIEVLSNANARLAVHIADVSHFVTPDTSIDREAYERGNSVYLPDHVLPMLPEVLCNGIASLQPDRLRFTKTVFMTFSPRGVCTDVEICDSVICSNARLNYEQVDRFFAGDTSELPDRVQDVLQKFRTLARILRARRTAKGKLDINLPEISLELDRDGRVTGIKREINTESHQMIEEFMVSANEAVAQELVSAGSNLMRRVHKYPTMEKLIALGDFLEDLGLTISQKADRFELQTVLEKTAGTPNEFAVHQAILRAMQRAEYSPEEEGHYALASECYCHFTSPIRRYADLTIHRQVENYILGVSPKRNFRKIYDEGQHLTFCEMNAEEAERELTRIKMIRFFSEKGDMELDARIVGLTHQGFFVECTQYPLSGLVPVSCLPQDRYRYDSRTQTLNGFHRGNLFRLGDSVRVHIAKIDPNRREIDFELADSRKSKSSKPTGAAAGETDGQTDGQTNSETADGTSSEVSTPVFAGGRPGFNGMKTLHTRVGSKKVQKYIDQHGDDSDWAEDEEPNDFEHFVPRAPRKSAPKRSTGAGGGKKSVKDSKKMTRKKK